MTVDLAWPDLDGDALIRLQDKRLRATLVRASTRHPVYRERLAEVTAYPDGDWSPRAVLDTLPPTTKSEFAARPDQFRVEPEQQPPSIAESLWDVIYTSGTTAAPCPIYQTSYDFRVIITTQLRMARMRGLGPADRVGVTFPLTPRPNGSWTRVSQGIQALGIPVLTGRTGPASLPFAAATSTEQLAEDLIRFGPTVLWGTPQYIERLLRAMPGGARLPNLRTVVTSGEPLSTERRERVLAAGRRVSTRDVSLSEGFGASELQCSFIQCSEPGRFHHPAPDYYLVQALDDDGRPVASGVAGRLAVTHLDRRGTLLLRYLTGDRAVLTDGTCPSCGADGPTLRHLGRTDSRVKVNATLIEPSGVVAAIRRIAGTDRFRCVVRSEGPARPDKLYVELAIESAAEYAAMSARLLDQLPAMIGLTPVVVPVERTTSGEWMSASFVDQRPTAAGATS